MTDDAGAYFDTLVRRYDSAYDASSADGHALRARMAAVLEFVGAGQGEIVDAGMGPGRLCQRLAEAGWAVSGVDASGEMVRAARARLPGAAKRLLEGQIEALPFADGSFDAAAATGVLEYADVSSALAEIVRVLRTGGIAVVSYPNPYAAYGLWKRRIFYPAVRSAKLLLRLRRAATPPGSGTIAPRQFVQMLEAVGLRVERIEYTGYLVIPSPLDSLLPVFSAAMAKRLEGRGPRLGRMLATQVVYAARKE